MVKLAFFNIPENYFIEKKHIEFCEYLLGNLSHEEIISCLNLIRNKYVDSVFFFEEMDINLFVANGVLGVVPFTKIVTEGLTHVILPGQNFLDVGCGCGYSSIVAAKKGNTGLCVDINYAAVLSTKINAIWNGVFDKLEFVHDDFALITRQHKFDVMFSNPPLVAVNSLVALEHYRNLLNKTSEMKPALHAISSNTDYENISLVDRMFMSTLLKNTGVIIIGSGEIKNFNESLFNRKSEKYSFKLIDKKYSLIRFIDFKNKDGTLVFKEDFVDKQFEIGIELFNHSGTRINSKNNLSCKNIYFKGFWLVYSRLY